MNQSESKSIAKLVVNDAGQRFKGGDFRALRQPGVYLFVRQGIPLYVGMGNMVLGRIGNWHKQAEEAIAECDEVLIYPCISLEAARKLEELLIQRLQPKYNWKQRHGLLKDWLGLSNSRAIRISKESRQVIASAQDMKCELAETT